MTGATLEIRGLSAALDGTPVLHECGFSVAPGEYLVIAGPNGAGKSTLLRVLAGLVGCTGSLAYGGQELGSLPLAQRARLVAFLPQNGTVHWPMEARDVVALGRLPFGANLQSLSAIDAALVDAALADCAAGSLAHRSATALSGGELSRVLLARLLAGDTPIILADEPAAALDPAHRLAVMDLLARKAARGRIVIAVSHDIALAARYATRIVLLEHGRIAGDGAPRDLLDSGLLQRIFGVRFHRIADGAETAIAITPQ